MDHSDKSFDQSRAVELGPFFHQQSFALSELPYEATPLVLFQAIIFETELFN